MQTLVISLILEVVAIVFLRKELCMKSGQFLKVAITEGNNKWQDCIQREYNNYHRDDDIRSPFTRDYNRILHCTAYRRLKHKTQVFFATKNDHICTRIEHVNHVSSVSYTISKYLGLNPELSIAIATGHDLGHAPFGHAGEDILKKIAMKDLGDVFWHEKNSLRFVDKCETLPGPTGDEFNLDLTYAVRDGIISHCGEVDETAIFPRNNKIDLESIESTNQYFPYTWEACIVKIADKIAYLGRDIEDALNLKILTRKQLKELIKIVKKNTGESLSEINNTAIMHKFIVDICNSSSPNSGICLSKNHFSLMKELRAFSSEYIYQHERLKIFINYAQLILESIYKTLKKGYRKKDTLKEINSKYYNTYPLLISTFSDWLRKYSDNNDGYSRESKYKNCILYDMNDEKQYLQAIIDFISGMTDSFAIKVFNELTTF